MADLLKQVLGKNGGLQLVELKTLPVSLLIEKPQASDIPAQPIAPNSPDGNKQPGQQKQIFKHGVQITVRGGYLDLMRYVDRAGENACSDVLGGSEFERGKIS